MITAELLREILPQPPLALTQTSIDGLYAPAPEIAAFATNHFLNPDSELYNSDHQHLQYANFGFLWTNTAITQKQKHVAAMAMLPTIQGNKWAKGIFDYQLAHWFPLVHLDFLLIFDTNYASHVIKTSPASFLALIEHELYHCAQKIDKYGELMFDDETGLPKLALQGHDVEEFVGIMRRYGVNACAGETKAFIEASKHDPLFSDADIIRVCGNCMALRA